ncbi:unnamed protein product [Leptosia nina]|uniref:Transcription factor IIIC 90kDa subunit N-terminal domain-containing protein n=1 Tax=Leptosia nina TaxID=320188 RepID=A0AAV1IY52_9NEOP
MDFIEYAIPCPKNSNASKFLIKFTSKALKNIELVDLITDRYLWPYSDQLKDQMTNIMAFEWSPSNLIHNKQSVLAILNSVGNVEFFGLHRKLWISLIDFSSVVKQSQMIKEEFVQPKSSMAMERLRDIVYSLTTSAICWAPNINEDGSCYFVTAQRNSTIIIWNVKWLNNNFVVDKIGIILADTEEITSLVWIPITDDTFFFIYANILGEVVGKTCKIEKNKLDEISTTVLWKYKDRMVPRDINYIMVKEQLTVIYSKHRHLVVQVFDQNLKLLYEAVKIINDDKITVVTKVKNDFFIGTVSVKIYKVNSSISNNELKIEFKQIPLKETYANHELYGLAFSPQSVLCHMILLDRKVNYRKEQLQMLIATFSFEDTCEENILINNNSSARLTNMWDCLELLRYRTMKLKKLPNLDYKEFYESAKSDIYKMKIYLAFVKLNRSLDGILKNLSKGMLPETSIDIVQDELLVLHASSVLKTLYKKQRSNDLSPLENEWLFGCCNYLKYYSKKYDKPVEKLILNSLWNDVSKFCKSKLSRYTCQFCDEKIDGFTCETGHANTFCMVTFTQINSLEYLECKSCGSLAREELYELKPVCVFCDTNLEFHNNL